MGSEAQTFSLQIGGFLATLTNQTSAEPSLMMMAQGTANDRRRRSTFGNEQREERRRHKSLSKSTAEVAYLAVADARREREADLYRRLGDVPVRRRNPYEELQRCLDEASAERDFFMQEIAGLTPQQLAWQTGHRKLLHLVHYCRAEIAQLAQAMIKLGLDERVAALQEVQVQIMVSAIVEVLKEQGLTEKQIANVGIALKKITPAELERVTAA